MTTGARARRVLRCWDAGRDRAGWDRSVALAAGATADGATANGAAADGADEGFWHRPLGETNRALLEVRAALIGPDLEVVTSCPDCHETVAAELAVETLLDTKPTAAEGVVAEGEHEIAWRAPTPVDLAGLGPHADSLTRLRERCVAAPDGLPDSVWAALDQALEEADPLAYVVVDTTCAGCGHAFLAHLDVGEFVWRELEAASIRVLHEIDLLARAYGWSEREILALEDSRRAAYVRLITEGRP